VKIIIGLLLAFSLCLVSNPAQAASFGLSPAMVDYQITKGSSKTMEFTVVGYSGTVDINAESMPVSVSPASVSVVAGSKIVVTVKCNDDATDGLYEGKIVFLAKSGNSVMSGIKVRCNLTVGNSSSPAKYSGSGSSAGSSGNSVGSSAIGAIPSSPVIAPLVSSTSLIQNIQNQGKETLPISSGATGNKEFNFIMFALIVCGGLLLAGLVFVGYRWMQQRKRI
jgi:hypothetical protein